MTDCWILYDPADLEKNEYFARHLQECGRELGMRTSIVTTNSIPKGQVPDAVVSRQRDWELSSRLEDAGAKVFNSSEVCRVCNDKSLTYDLMDEIGVPFLPYCFPGGSPVVPGPPWVVKSCYGHGGMEVARAFNMEGVVTTCLFMKGRKPIIQQYASDPGKDMRIYVLDGEVLASVMRRSTVGFRANRSLGGTSELVEPPGDALEIVEKIVPVLKADLVGIDFVFGDGKAFLNEIEDVVGTRMLYEHTDLDAARLLMGHVHSKMSL